MDGRHFLGSRAVADRVNCLQLRFRIGERLYDIAGAFRARPSLLFNLTQMLNDYPTMTDWDTRLSRMVVEQKSARTAGTWLTGHTDLLSVLGRARDELTHSCVLGWLLSPVGKHGLGTALLDLLVEELQAGDRCSETSAALVSLELSRPQSRADIVVVAPTFSIVIEVKIDAVEQSEQCERLARDHPTAHLVFLTPHRQRLPKSALGQTLGRWHPLSWQRVNDLLGDALTNGDATKPGRASAIEYQRTLEKEFI